MFYFWLTGHFSSSLFSKGELIDCCWLESDVSDSNLGCYGENMLAAMFATWACSADYSMNWAD